MDSAMETADRRAEAELPAIRPLKPGDIGWALGAGWTDYRARRGELLLLPLIYVVVGALAALIAFRADLLPLLFPVAAGFALVGPIAAAGFHELARRREAGEESGWSHFLDPLNGRARWPLIGLTLMAGGLFFAWLWVALALHGATLGNLGVGSPQDFISRIFGTPEGRTLLVAGNALGFLFAIGALVMLTFSVPMVVDRGTDPVTAVMTSIRIFLASPGPVLGWGLAVALILLLASIPLFVGLMVALPVLGYATWHLYTRAIVR